MSVLLQKDHNIMNTTFHLIVLCLKLTLLYDMLYFNKTHCVFNKRIKGRLLCEKVICYHPVYGMLVQL